jgi:mono/diheme cytochrome c family protein
MNHRVFILTVLGATAAGTWLAATAAPAAAPVNAELAARGRHLVERIALCTDCHSPRLPTGEFDPARWLQGAPIGFKPLVEMPWTTVAPPIAGLPGRNDDDVITLLTTAKRADGSAPLPPMPSYQMSADEARAIVAFLRSLAPAN